MNIIKFKLLILLIFFNIINIASAIKLVENNYYSGTLKDNNRNNIPLPPGEWQLTEIKHHKVGIKGAGTGYIEYQFFNSTIGYVLYFGPKGGSIGERWQGGKTPSVCDGNPIVGKTNISGPNNYEWCAYHDGEFIEFRNYTTRQFNQYIHHYYIKKSLLKNTNKPTIQSIGSQIFDQVKKNKAGDLSFLSNHLDFNKSSSANNQGRTQSNAIKIDGISLNDSMLDFLSLDEIKKAIRDRKLSYPNSDKFYDVSFESSDGEFDEITVSFKKNDNQYKSYKIDGSKFCDTQKECKKIFNKQVNSIRNLIPNAEEDEYEFIYPKNVDSSGKSIAYIVDFMLASNNIIRVYNIDWSSNVDFKDNVRLDISSNEYMDFLEYDAY